MDNESCDALGFPAAKRSGLAKFKGTDRVQSYQLVMRTELIYNVGLHLRLGNLDCSLRYQMDPVKQRIVPKLLFFKSLGCKITHRNFWSVLGQHTCSLSQTKGWVRGFKDSDLSCEDQDWSRRRISDLTDRIRSRLKKFPFTSTKVLTKPFRTSVPTISRILKMPLGLEKF
jgi:hypothetical protein